MQQLSGIDSAFLSMETATTFGHISSLIIYRPPDRDDFNPYEAYRSQILARLDRAAPLRRRLVEVPLGLDHPYWIDDPNFDIDFHVRHLAVPPPGTREKVQEMVSRLVARPLDRSRPLWEVYVIEGLDDGTFAVLTKTHHAALDGAAGAQMTIMMLDTDPDQDPEQPAALTWSDASVPSALELLGRTGVQYLTRPTKLARLQVRMLRNAASSGGAAGPLLSATADAIRRGIPGITPPPEDRHRADSLEGLPARAAPETPLNRTITAQRRFSYRAFDLADIKTIKTAFGATINDVVMALCAGALRRYLTHHDALPDDPLIAMVPMSIRTGDEADPWTNRVSSLFVSIPTDLDDIDERIASVHDAMAAAKKRHDLIPAEELIGMAEAAPPALSHQAIMLASRLRLADRFTGVANLVISNVPGPRSPLYFAGAEMQHFYPISIVTDGQGLNITVQSYVDSLDVGLIAAATVVPDLELVMDLLAEELDAMLKAAADR